MLLQLTLEQLISKLSVYIPLGHRQHPGTERMERGWVCVYVHVLGLIPKELKWTGFSLRYAAIQGSEVKMT